MDVYAFIDLTRIDLLLLTSSVPFFIGLASFSLNDLLDVESDRINQRTERPLVSGHAKPHEAFDLAVLGFIIGIAISYAISPLAFFIAVLFSILAILYNAWLKDLPLAGNAYIASTMAVPFLYGSLMAAETISGDIAVLSTIAFLVGLGREFMKTASDVKGDREARHAFTLPMSVGIRTPGPFEGDIAYLLLITLANALFVFSAYKSLEEGEAFLRRARNLSLLALGIGLLAFLAGSLM